MKLYEAKKHFDELLTELGNSRRASRQIVKWIEVWELKTVIPSLLTK